MQLKDNYGEKKRSDKTEVGPSGSQKGSRTAAGRAPSPEAGPIPTAAPTAASGGRQRRRGRGWEKSLSAAWPGRGPTCSACSGKDSVAPTTTLALASSFSARSMLATHCGGEKKRQVTGPLSQTPEAARPLSRAPGCPPPGPALTQFLDLKYRTHWDPSAPLPPYTSTLPVAAMLAACLPRSGSTVRPGPACACGLPPCEGRARGRPLPAVAAFPEGRAGGGEMPVPRPSPNLPPPPPPPEDSGGAAAGVLPQEIPDPRLPRALSARLGAKAGTTPPRPAWAAAAGCVTCPPSGILPGLIN